MIPNQGQKKLLLPPPQILTEFQPLNGEMENNEEFYKSNSLKWT